jgi:hypothetical protein
MSHQALEEWAELGGGRKDLLVARHAQALVGYLRAVAPGLVKANAMRAQGAAGSSAGLIHVLTRLVERLRHAAQLFM